MATLGHVSFSVFNYNIQFLFPSLVVPHTLRLWAAGQLRVVLPDMEHILICIQIGIILASIVFLKNDCIVINYSR